MNRLTQALLTSLPMAIMLLAVPFIHHAHAADSAPRLFVQYEAESKPDNGAQGIMVWFIQDRETGTRCYGIRSNYHDGVAISCVPKQ